METPELDEAVSREPHPMTDNSKAERQLKVLKAKARLADIMANHLRQRKTLGKTLGPDQTIWLTHYEVIPRA